MTDMLIMGAGVAGLTAAIYGIRAGLDVLVLDKQNYGGQAAVTFEIENYPGIRKISGFEFAEQIYQQAKDLGCKYIQDEILSAEFSDKEIKLVSAQREYLGRTLIVASGAKRRLLNVPGEEGFTGKGVSYCATCDGAFFRGKKVFVAGGGNVALEDALYLSKLCSQVTIVHRRDQFRAEKPLIQAVKDKENIEIFWNTEISEIKGEQKISSLLLQGEHSGEQNAEGLFIAIGYEPDNEIFKEKLALDKNGYLIAGENCQTSLPGVYAAGDCRTKELRQIVTAAADGAVSAYHAASYLQLHSVK